MSSLHHMEGGCCRSICESSRPNEINGSEKVILFLTKLRVFWPRPEATIVYKQRYMYLGDSLMPIWFNHRSKFPTWAYDLPRPWLVADFLILNTLTPSMGLTSDPIKGQLVTSSAAKPRLHRWVYLPCRPAFWLKVFRWASPMMLFFL